MTTILAPWLSLSCDDPDACGGDCGPCGVELNPWMPFALQQYGEQQAGAGSPPPRIPGTSSVGLERCLDDLYEPGVIGTAPSTDIGGGVTFGWWSDPAESLSEEAFGFVVHSFSLTEPRTFPTARADQLRGRMCLLDGILLGDVVVEAVGASRHAAKWLAGLLKRRLEHAGGCCTATAEVSLGPDCGSEAGSPRRRLTGVSEWHVTQIEGETLTRGGVLLSVVFAADTVAEFPDDETATVAGAALGAATISCPATTESEDFTTFTPRTIKTADVELRTDGNLYLCPRDYTSFNPATDFLEVGEVRAVDPATIVPCPIQVDIDMRSDPPVVTPVQPDLWQTHVLDVRAASEELDCVQFPIVPRRITYENPDFDPLCGDCPPEAKAADCAAANGITVTGPGFADFGMTGGSSHRWQGSTATVIYSSSGEEAEVGAALNYLKCIGAFDIEAFYNQYVGDDIIGGGVVSQVHIKYHSGGWVFGAGDGTDVLCATITTLTGYLGQPSTAVVSSDLDGCPYTFTNQKLAIPQDEELSACLSSAPLNCRPIVTVAPTGTGPCVELTISTGGSITASEDVTDGIWGDAQITFGPCATTTIPDCPGVIPPSPTFDVNTGTGIVTPVGWSVGYGWPLDTDGSAYAFADIDGSPNESAPIEGIDSRQVPIAAAQCTPPCSIGASFSAEPLSSGCWPAIVGDQEIYVATVTGLSSSRTYRPIWSLSGSGLLDQVEVFLWPAAAADPAPSLGTIEDFVCGGDLDSLPIVAIAADETVSHDHRGVLVECAAGTVDAFAGWVDSAAAWSAPEICGAGSVHMIVTTPTSVETPTFSLKLVPIAVP